LNPICDKLSPLFHFAKLKYEKTPSCSKEEKKEVKQEIKKEEVI